MDVKTFASALARSLMERGIPREAAVKHSVSLVRTFDEEDLREVTSYRTPRDFDDLADGLAEIIKEKIDLKKDDATEENKEAFQNETLTKAETAVFKISEVKGEDEIAQVSATAASSTREIPKVYTKDASPKADIMKTRAFVTEKKGESITETQSTRTFDGVKAEPMLSNPVSDITAVNIPVIKEAYADDAVQEIYLDEEGPEDEKVVLTKRGKAFFWGITVAISPLLLIACVLVLGVFALGIVTMCALIGAAIMLVCGEAVAGFGLAFVGIIYGAIEIVGGNMGIGIYEIGFGLCCGGLFLALGILTYNLAVVVLPYVLKQLISFEGYFIKRVGPLVNRFREECNRL